MTYEKYINGYQGLTPTEVAFSCLKSLVYGDENNFTKHVDDKGISAHEYASQYVYSMSTISSDWKASCFMQMMQDVCLEYSKQNEQAQKKQHESPITIKKFFPSVFFRAKEKLSSGIINGVERRVPGNLPGMYFAQDIGNTGKKQEDAIIVMEHPSFKGLRMAMISDGMGGTNNGEVASHMVIAELKKWFEKLRIDPDSVDTGTLRMSLAQKIKEISSKIIKTQGENCGATLTGAIIGKKDAVVVNIGDSRTYLVKNGNLRQVTVDHSLAQIEYENYFRNVYPGMKPDDMRFWRRSNEITRSIGINVDNSIPDFVHLDKGAFDKLILCSDGVSDCLSFDQVATYSNRLSKKELANALVNGGLITVSDFDKNMDGLVRQIPAGKDDTTAVVD